MVLRNSDEVLVYVPNLATFADVVGYVYIAKVVKKIEDTDLTIVTLLTDSLGNYVKENKYVIINPGQIISYRQFVEYNVNEIYCENDDGTSFVFKNKNTVVETSNSGFGSGIYGVSDKIDGYDIIVKIPHPLHLQDKEHGISLSVASLQTNRLVDKILNSSLDNYSEESVVDIMLSYGIENIVLLWNMFLYRIDLSIDREEFIKIILKYINDYKNTNELFDSRTKEPLAFMPINYILLNLGFDGIIAHDYYNNGWSRGSVSFELPDNINIFGSTAYY